MGGAIELTQNPTGRGCAFTVSIRSQLTLDSLRRGSAEKI